jgi:hypothetical protein
MGARKALEYPAGRRYDRPELHAQNLTASFAGDLLRPNDRLHLGTPRIWRGWTLTVKETN